MLDKAHQISVLLYIRLDLQDVEYTSATSTGSQAVSHISFMTYVLSNNRCRCDMLEYIGGSGWPFVERLKDHFRILSPIYDQANTTGHHPRVDNFSLWVGSGVTSSKPARRLCI